MSEEPTTARSATSATADRFDVLRYTDGTHRAVPAGAGQPIVGAHVRESRKRQFVAAAATALIAVVTVVLGGIFFFDALGRSLGVALVLGAVAAVLRAQYWTHDDFVPDLVVSDVTEHVVRDYVEDFDPTDVPDSVT